MITKELPESIAVKDESRFWSKVDLLGPDGCWNWLAGKKAAGYGQFFIQGEKAHAHRLAYTLLVGPIPEGRVLDHLCRNRACVNPAHLEPVEQKVNVHRGAGNGSQSNCKYGHPYSGTNLYTSNGKRYCRACRAEYTRSRRRRR